MKIAIPVQEERVESKIGSVFGRAPFFALSEKRHQGGASSDRDDQRGPKKWLDVRHGNARYRLPQARARHRGGPEKGQSQLLDDHRYPPGNIMPRRPGAFRGLVHLGNPRGDTFWT